MNTTEHAHHSTAEAVIDELAAAYAMRRVTVVGLIFAKPSQAVTGLADAFKLRKDR